MIHVVNGPNLNLLGEREPNIYGTNALNELIKELEHLALERKAQIACYQSNHEGDIIDYLQSTKKGDFVILNAGGLSHTSVCLRDCIAAIESEVIEVHISNIASREPFRSHSLISAVCKGVIYGFKTDVYKMAMEWCLKQQA